MTEAEFRAYIDAFNRDDFDLYSSYYADDVEICWRGGEITVRGKDAIVRRYRELHKKIRQRIDLQWVLAGREHVAGEGHTTFTALEDVPDFIVRPLKAGDVVRIHTFIHYDLNDAGKFCRIRSLRYAILD
jgi:hypothetical protein